MRKKSVSATVLEAIKTLDYATTSAICQKTGLNRTVASLTLSTLQELGHVESQTIGQTKLWHSRKVKK